MGEEQVKSDSRGSERDQVAMAAANALFKIIYLFPHPQQRLEDASHFGWYTPGILSSTQPVLQACALPADLREAHSDTEDVLLHRLVGTIWPSLLPIEIDSLEEAIAVLPSPFVVCVTTNAEVAARTDHLVTKHSVPVLHFSSVAGPGRKPPQAFNLAEICAHLRKVIDSLALREASAPFARQCRRLLAEAPQRKLRKHPLRLGLHNVTTPNEVALAAFGFKFPVHRAISKPIDHPERYSPDEYVKRICQSADAVSAERAQLLSGRPSLLRDHRAIVAVASSFAGLYGSWKDMLQRAPEQHRRELRHALALVVRSNSYFHSLEPDEDGNPPTGPFFKVLTSQLAADMRAFTAALTMMSSATLCPVLRLEPKLNQVRSDAAELARCVRAQAGPRPSWKQSRMVRLLGQRMRSLVHPDFLKRIDAKEEGRIEGLRLVTDLPLELLPSNGIPLGLRFDTSRISPVPGNLFWQTCGLPPVRVKADAFYDVLVIRSFTASDPIRTFLEQSIKVVQGQKRFTRVRYRFVDVQTPAEFVTAVRSHKGAVMIFDGHGRYDASVGIGRLVVGGVPLDTWALKRDCELPPVVMFSACDTQPIEGHHGSVATAAFALGARAVLGTMFPVDAVHSSIMMARMLLRIDQFLPIALTLFPSLTWRHVVSGMLRMSHTTEAARLLNARAHLGLTENALSRVQLTANTQINSWLPNWFDEWVNVLAKEASRPIEDIRNLLQQHVGLTDAMKYVQLGNPERIVIC